MQHFCFYPRFFCFIREKRFVFVQFLCHPHLYLSLLTCDFRPQITSSLVLIFVYFPISRNLLLDLIYFLNRLFVEKMQRNRLLSFYFINKNNFNTQLSGSIQFNYGSDFIQSFFIYICSETLLCLTHATFVFKFQLTNLHLFQCSMKLLF